MKWIPVALALTVCAGAGHALTLVKHGKPASVIVLPENASDIEKRSASELQKYIKLMSGAELETTSAPPPESDAILIGRRTESLALVGKYVNDEHLGYDGIILKTVGNKLIVFGRDGNGQLHAVYDLLKRLGCRFYLPYPDGEVIPQTKNISVGDLDVVHKSPFLKRHFWNNGNVQPSLLHPEWYDKWEPKVYQRGARMSTSHSFSRVCRASEYFEAHPEYFPLRMTNGEMKRVSSGQLCISNPEVVKLFADAAIAGFDADPDLRAFSLSPNDTKGWCECEKCKAMDSPDPKVGCAWRMLRFANQVAEVVAKKYPNRWLAYYAEYMNLPGPPIGMKAHPMILPIIVNRYDMMHPISDPYMGDTSKTGIHYNPTYIKVFNTWEKIAKQVGAYEWFNFSDGPRLPSPQLYIAGERIKFYADRGVISYYIDGNGRSPVNDITMYLVGQMLWDADQDPKQMIDEFFRLYFAEAGPAMREYYDALHQISYFSNENRGAFVYTRAWTPEIISNCDDKLKRAEAAAQQDVVKRRILRERKTLKVIDLCASANRLTKAWTDNHGDTTRAAARAKIDEAVAYLGGLAGEDLVPQAHMIKNMRSLIAELDKKPPAPAEKGLQP